MQAVGKGHQAEIQGDSLNVECRGCGQMKGLDVEMEQLTELVIAGGRWEGETWFVSMVPVEEQ